MINPNHIITHLNIFIAHLNTFFTHDTAFAGDFLYSIPRYFK